MIPAQRRWENQSDHSVWKVSDMPGTGPRTQRNGLPGQAHWTWGIPRNQAGTPIVCGLWAVQERSADFKEHSPSGDSDRVWYFCQRRGWLLLLNNGISFGKFPLSRQWILSFFVGAKRLLAISRRLAPSITLVCGNRLFSGCRGRHPLQ